MAEFLWASCRASHQVYLLFSFNFSYRTHSIFRSNLSTQHVARVRQSPPRSHSAANRRFPVQAETADEQQGHNLPLQSTRSSLFQPQQANTAGALRGLLTEAPADCNDEERIFQALQCRLKKGGGIQKLHPSNGLDKQWQTQAERGRVNGTSEVQSEEGLAFAGSLASDGIVMRGSRSTAQPLSVDTDHQLLPMPAYAEQLITVLNDPSFANFVFYGDDSMVQAKLRVQPHAEEIKIKVSHL